MTITLLCSTAAESLKIETQIIEADPSIEILNPYHEDPVIYKSRMPDPDNMVKRTIVRLVCMSDLVLNLSGQDWFNPVFDMLKIPVYHTLEEIMATEESPVEIPEPVEEELWCGGCKISTMSPMPQHIEVCPYRDKACPTYRSFEDAINGENPI